MADFGTVKTVVNDHLARSDVSTYLDRWVQQGQRWLEQQLRIREMISTNTFSSVSSNTLSLPSDYLEDEGLFLKPGSNEFKPIDKFPGLTELRLAWRNLGNTGEPKGYATSGASIYLSHAPDNQDLDLVYYARFATLNNDPDTNWLTDNESDLLIYASLLFAQPYLVNDERIQVWRNFVNQGIQSLNMLHMSEKDNSANVAQRILAGSGAES